MKALFVDVTGQMDNIGDSLLRRGMLDSIRHPEIELHIHVGASTPGYLSGLGVQGRDILYHTRRDWISALKVDRGRGGTSFLANAGETMRLRGPRHLGPRLQVGLLEARRRGGALLHTGVGIRDLTWHPRVARINPLKFFDLVTWRDDRSRAYARIGEVQPDWGYATGTLLPATSAPRHTLAVSVRGDRMSADDAWIRAVRTVAEALDSRIVTFSQVERDGREAEALAERLEAADCVVWESTSHADQEARVRALFRESTGVISDRVHALIVGATEGAYPVGLPPVPNEKSQRTLDVIGFRSQIPSVADLTAHVPNLDLTMMYGEVVDGIAEAKRQLASRAHQIVDAVLGR